MSEALDTLREQLAEVSPQWRDVTGDAPAGSTLGLEPDLGDDRARGVEAIREDKP